MAPRSKKTYGNTPWGARLKAQLTSLGGRIDRGEALARTGKVFDTALRNGRLRARVRGSFAPFYEVSLTFAAVPPAQRAAVARVVAADLLLSAELVSGNLPVALLDALEDAGVTVLPQSFAELRGTCDCPDNAQDGGRGMYGHAAKSAADPCKHQAACMFELIGELDRNPRTLLALRGIDVDALVGTRDGAAGAAPAGAGELTYPLPTAAFRPPAEPASRAREPAQRLTFPPFQNSAKIILQALAPSPLFSKEDFAAVLASFYGYLTDKKVTATLGAAEPWEKKLDVAKVQPLLERARYTLNVFDSLSTGRVRVVVDSDVWSLSDGEVGVAETNAHVADDDKVEAERDASFAAQTPESTLDTIPFKRAKRPNERDGVSPRVTLDLDTFRRVLMAMPSDGSVGSESYLFFFYAVRASLLMFSSSNMVPDIVPLSEPGVWNVFYRPFSSTTAVADCISRLEKAYPRLDGCVVLQTKGDAGGSVVLDANAGVLHSLSVMLTQLVCGIGFNSLKKSTKAITPERGAFFRNQPYTSFSFSDKSNGLVAKRWLSVFGLLAVEAEVLLKLDEVVPNDPNGMYALQLYFRSCESTATGDGQVVLSQSKRENALHSRLDPVSTGWQVPREYMAEGSQQSKDALKFVVALKNYIPEVRRLVNEGVAEIDASMFSKFILECSGVLRSLGTSVVLPKGIKRVLKPRLVTELSMMDGDTNLSSWRKGYLQLASLLNFNYRVMLGDESVDLEEFAKMVDSGRRLFEFKGKFVEMDVDHVQGLLHASSKPPPRPTNAMELLREVLSGDLKYSLSELVAELIGDLQRGETPAVPSALCATLRPYQVSGYQWIMSNLRSVGGAALCDDMGLGKTVQAIAVLLALKEAEHLDESPALIVCPTSLLSNWKRELAKFAPSLKVKLCSGPGRAHVFKRAVGGKRKRNIGPDALLMSYGSVRQDVAMLSKAEYSIMIIDESQNIKNHKAALSKAVKKVGSQASLRLALTGTVVENRLAELHSCFDFALPNYLGTLKEFTSRFAKPIENKRDVEIIELLKRMTSCFMLRREKTDPSVISDLPDKIERKHYVKICPEQIALYESIRESVFDTMAANAAAPAGSGSKRNALVLKLLSDLKQICNHPAAYGDRPGDVGAERSQKCLDLLEMIRPIIDSGEKVLIFSQYVKTIRILEKQIATEFSVRPLVFEGSLSQSQRDSVIQQFDRNPARQVLLLSLKAGGVGLNLTSANHGTVFIACAEWLESASPASLEVDVLLTTLQQKQKSNK